MPISTCSGRDSNGPSEPGDLSAVLPPIAISANKRGRLVPSDGVAPRKTDSCCEIPFAPPKAREVRFWEMGSSIRS